MQINIQLTQFSQTTKDQVMNSTIREGISFVASAAILGAFTGGIGSGAVLGGTLFLTTKTVKVTDLGRALERKLEDCNAELAGAARIIVEIATVCFLAASIAIATGLTTASLPATTLFLGATFVIGACLDEIFKNCCSTKNRAHSYEGLQASNLSYDPVSRDWQLTGIQRAPVGRSQGSRHHSDL